MEKNYFGITDAGKVRDNNEDTFIAEQNTENDWLIACVIDGVGGYSGGEIASAIAKRAILTHLRLPNADLPALMRDAIIEADSEIMLEKKRDKAHEKMACVLTLAIADISRNQFHYIHVGDTRLYLFRDGSLVKISKDQSFVGFMEDSGRLTEEQAMRHPKRNEVNKALGFGANIAQQADYLEYGKSPFLPGDLLLLCSDGLSDMVSKREMTDILKKGDRLEDKAKKLVDLANRNGGLDNITVVLVQNNKKSKLPSQPQKVITETPSATAEIEAPATFQTGKPTPAAQPRATPAAKNRAVVVLSGLCVLLFAALIGLLWKHYVQPASDFKQSPIGAIKPPRNQQEKKLQDTLNKMTSDTIVITRSLFNSPILITNPIELDRDTIFLIADHELVIKRDSSFKAIPILIRPGCKFIYLENIRFDDFDTVISMQRNALELKHINFTRSVSPIATNYLLPPDKMINGKIPLSSFRADTGLTPISH